MPNPVKRCVDCGDAFQTSRTGKTVRCQSCRRKRASGGGGGTRAKAPATVATAGRRCTVRTSTGACGKPAVYSFKSSGGEIFSECAQHHR